MSVWMAGGKKAEPEDHFNKPGIMKTALMSENDISEQHYKEIVQFIWHKHGDSTNRNLKHVYHTKRVDPEIYKHASEQSKVSLRPLSPSKCVCI